MNVEKRKQEALKMSRFFRDFGVPVLPTVNRAAILSSRAGRICISYQPAQSPLDSEGFLFIRFMDWCDEIPFDAKRKRGAWNQRLSPIDEVLERVRFTFGRLEADAQSF